MDTPPPQDFHESNRDRLWRKWGGEKAFEAQKQRHTLKQRGQEVGIQKFSAHRVRVRVRARVRVRVRVRVRRPGGQDTEIQ